MVLLTSSDNEVFTVPREVAERSVMIKNMLEDLGESDDTPIPLPNVTAAILRKVIEYCEHHKNDPVTVADPEEDSRKRSDDIEEWDNEFMKVDQQTLFDIILASNYLDIKQLLECGCKTVANMIKDKSPEQIRTTFNIENDFTPEEEEQIRKENEWAEDR